MIEINNKTKSKINIKLVNAVTTDFLKYFKQNNKEVSIAFVGDKTIRKLNKTYRNIDSATDVLSFAGEDNFLGEIIINYTQIKKQAKQFGSSARKELIFILTHGLLHLLGHNDETDKDDAKMAKLSKEFIGKL